MRTFCTRTRCHRQSVPELLTPHHIFMNKHLILSKKGVFNIDFPFPKIRNSMWIMVKMWTPINLYNTVVWYYLISLRRQSSTSGLIVNLDGVNVPSTSKRIRMSLRRVIGVDILFWNFQKFQARYSTNWCYGGDSNVICVILHFTFAKQLKLSWNQRFMAIGKRFSE